MSPRVSLLVGTALAALILGSPVSAQNATEAVEAPGIAPPEYDPAADRHFLLPSGRVAPRGTGGAGFGGLASLPTFVAPFVGGSPLPRVSIGATAAFLFFQGDGGVSPVVGAVSVQPIEHGSWAASIMVAGVTNLGDVDFETAATVATLSYGSDARRVTFASGSLGRPSDGIPFAAVGFDWEVDRGEGSVRQVAGEPRTVRRRTKLLGELYAPMNYFSEGVVGLVGLRHSEADYWINVGVPVLLGPRGGAAWLPVVSFGRAF